MLKTGIFIDVQNLIRCGGWGVRFKVIRELAEAQGSTILRANAYLEFDREREEQDAEHRRKRNEFRDAIRRAGFQVVTKEVRRYRNSEGETTIKANTDLELVVDALIQSDGLDHVVLGTGDGDFVRLVRALQDRGKRVDLISFSGTSEELRRTADFHFPGYLVPGLLPMQGEDPDRLRGVMHWVNEEKGFGFLTVRTGLELDDVCEDVFCHLNDFTHRDGRPLTNKSFAYLKTRQTILEFSTEEQPDGKLKALGVTEFEPASD